MSNRLGKRPIDHGDGDDDDLLTWAIRKFGGEKNLPVPIPSNGGSGFKGVSKSGNRWSARLTDPATKCELKLGHCHLTADPDTVRCYCYPSTLLPC